MPHWMTSDKPARAENEQILRSATVSLTSTKERTLSKKKDNREENKTKTFRSMDIAHDDTVYFHAVDSSNTVKNKSIATRIAG